MLISFFMLEKSKNGVSVRREIPLPFLSSTLLIKTLSFFMATSSLSDSLEEISAKFKAFPSGPVRTKACLDSSALCLSLLELELELECM
ncbi:hypothetical protein EHP00_1085 [Ecytonucleospora hepatopenaei]|uniref:Uncharacterized protein n=1 Tax=Ecytonucleospora hepatopenaei TaxID=646526 RepID=A0A1W0E590_9MICR|nr:hypothetical protein EHP00_1085 [Ecytonucleospora hepatopenaei]